MKDLKEDDRHPLHASFQGVNRLCILAFNNTENGNNKVERDSHRKCFLPRVNITNYNVLIDGRNLMNQLMINQLMIKSKSMMKLEKL